MTKDEARVQCALEAERLIEAWLKSRGGLQPELGDLRDAIMDAILATHAEAKEEAAKVADERQMQDRERYQHETDWRQPYASNRVIRASMDIATAIRAQKHGEKE